MKCSFNRKKMRNSELLYVYRSGNKALIAYALYELTRVIVGYYGNILGLLITYYIGQRKREMAGWRCTSKSVFSLSLLFKPYKLAASSTKLLIPKWVKPLLLLPLPPTVEGKMFPQMFLPLSHTKILLLHIFLLILDLVWAFPQLNNILALPLQGMQ